MSIKYLFNRAANRHLFVLIFFKSLLFLTSKTLQAELGSIQVPFEKTFLYNFWSCYLTVFIAIRVRFEKKRLKSTEDVWEIKEQRHEKGWIVDIVTLGCVTTSTDSFSYNFLLVWQHHKVENRRKNLVDALGIFFFVHHANLSCFTWVTMISFFHMCTSETSSSVPSFDIITLSCKAIYIITHHYSFALYCERGTKRTGLESA